MKEIIVPLVAAIIGAVAGAGSSVWVMRTQLLIEFDKAKLETLQSQLQKFEQLLSQFSALTMQVEGDLTEKKLGSMYIDRFIQKAGLVRPYYHYLPKDLCDEISRVRNTISGFTIAAKMRKDIDDFEARRELEAMKSAETRIEEEITNNLRVWQAEISYLTSKK